MNRIPPIAELEEEFDAILADPGFIAVSEWHQPNTSPIPDEEAYLSRALEGANALKETLGAGFSE